MSSGGKAVVINSQERAVSTDINRLQSFAGANIAELLRYMLNVNQGLDDLDAGGLNVENTTLDSPLKAEVFGGLLVRPQNGSLALKIDPGVLMAVAPDGGPDDSNYKLVRDPGVPSVGSLAVGANASGSTRVDVIECSVADVVVETDNRDVYNTTSGLFTAASLTKAKQGQLVYRVRAGTPGAGFPGTDVGWLPLCVASVPTGTTDNSSVTFWDVRPLLSDREFGLANVSSEMPRITRVVGVVNESDYPGAARMSGVAEGVYQGRRIGGRIRAGGGISDADYVELLLAANTAVAPSPGAFWYVYLAFPFGLPRWARYVASGDRVPRSPRGIPVITSNPAPAGVYGYNFISLPPTLGFGSASAFGVCIAAGLAATVSAVTRIGDLLLDGYGNYPGGQDFTGNVIPSSAHLPVDSVSLPNNYGGANEVAREWLILPGTHYPANARALHVSLTLGALSVLSGVELQIERKIAVRWGNVNATSKASTVFDLGTELMQTVVRSSSLIPRVDFRLPIPHMAPPAGDYPGGVPPTAGIVVSWLHNIAAATATVGVGSTLTVNGWEIAP